MLEFLTPLANRNVRQFVFGRGPQAIVPPDVAGLRAQQIQLLMSLLQPGAFNTGGAGNAMFFGGRDPNAPTPEQTTFNAVRPLLEAMLTGSGPQFERDIAMANSQGGRFSSGNAILRGEAFRHLFNQRDQTAQTLGMLSGAAGQSQRDQQAQLTQLIAGLMGMSGQATLSLPVENDRGAFGDILKTGAALFGSGG